jgi:rubrerythrin
MELGTFGAILRCAIDTEKKAAAYYEQVASTGGGTSDALTVLGKTHKKRQQLLEQIRREYVTEMILEPIHGLCEEDWAVDLSAGGLGKAVELEEKSRGFYTAAAEKVSVPQVARTFRKLADENGKLLDQAKSRGQG